MIPRGERRWRHSLRFPVEFFGATELEEPSTDGVSFRGLAAMTARQRDMAISAGAFSIALNRWIESQFRLPETDLPSMRGFEPESAAEALRARWELGQEPCPNMVHLMESRGVRVFSLPRDSASVHAFSFWHDERPFVFLTTDTSGEKGRMDAAHEIGHLVMHRHLPPAGRAAEFEAEQFASAFLMPRASVLANAPKDHSLQTLTRLKRRWKVSLIALVHRLHRLNLISEWQYRSLCIEASQLGYRRSEPNGIGREGSKVFPKVLSALRSDGVGRREIARALLIQPSDFDGIAFGLSPSCQ